MTAEQTKQKSGTLGALVLKHWADNKSVTLSMREMFGKDATGLFLAICDRKATWRYDRYGFKCTIGLFLIALPSGIGFGVMMYEDVIKAKQLLDEKLQRAADDTQHILSSQQTVISELRAEKSEMQKLVKDLQKRLEALEAERIERDLGAPA